VIDLSLMKAIKVDATHRTARAQGGVLWRELDRATQASGLAVPGGTDSEVGTAGLTLGGGNGWLSRNYGGAQDVNLEGFAEPRFMNDLENSGFFEEMNRRYLK
jgi:FAD/FMN-containing dehydrogenase